MSHNIEIGADDWRTLILKYLIHQTQPSNKMEAYKLQVGVSLFYNRQAPIAMINLRTLLEMSIMFRILICVG